MVLGPEAHDVLIIRRSTGLRRLAEIKLCEGQDSRKPPLSLFGGVLDSIYSESCDCIRELAEGLP